MAESVLISERNCVAPLDRVDVPSGYTHYPRSQEDMGELQDDLREFTELTPVEVADLLGYTAAAMHLNCKNNSGIQGDYQQHFAKKWGANNFTTPEEVDAYVAGRAEAFAQAKEVEHV